MDESRLIIEVDYSQMKLGDKLTVETKEFRTAFAHYMDEKNINPKKLSYITGVSERTIWRYRNEKDKQQYDLRTIIALCIGLHLYIKRSLQLINLAGLSLKPSEEHDIYLDFLGKAYCSNLTVKEIDRFIEEEVNKEDVRPLIKKFS